MPEVVFISGGMEEFTETSPWKPGKKVSKRSLQ